MSKPADGKVKFGPWLPDLPDLDNPGLTDCKNVIPVEGGYRPFNPLAGNIYALAERPQGGLAFPNPPASHTTYVGTATKLYISGVDKSGAAYNTASSGFWRFAEYRGLIVATNGVDFPQRQTLASGANFAALASTGTAPKAVHVGTIGQFVVLGSLTTTQRSRIQWPAIDDPTDWPTPGTADAVSKQAGAQDFDAEYGYVTGIASGDQFGIVLQNAGLTRMTYIGGVEVFQFDQYEFGRGAFFENATVQAAGWTYFIGIDGFYRTNGVDVQPIGAGRINRWFFSQLDAAYPERVYGAWWGLHRCVAWSIPTSASTSGRPKLLLFYHYDTDRWSYTDQEIECPIGLLGATGTTATSFGSAVFGFNSSHQLQTFEGTPGTAILTTAEVEMTPGGRTQIQGVKPLIQHTSTVTATVAAGTRDRLDAAVTYTAESTPHARTGFADFRSDAYFHRARTTITGNFTTAIGVEFQQVPTGAV